MRMLALRQFRNLDSRRRCLRHGRRIADNSLYLVRGTRAGMNAFDYSCENIQRQWRLLARTASRNHCVKVCSVLDVYGITVYDREPVKCHIPAGCNLHNGLLWTSHAPCVFKSFVVLGCRKGNHHAFVAIAPDHYTEMGLCGRQCAVRREIYVTSSCHSPPGGLYAEVAKRSVFQEYFFVEIDNVLWNIAKLVACPFARKKKVRIAHSDACSSGLYAGLSRSPFRKAMCIVDKIVMNRPLGQRYIKRFSFGFAYLREIRLSLALYYENRLSTASLLARVRYNYVLRQFLIVRNKNILDEFLRSGGNRSKLHGVVCIPQNRRGVFTQMIPICKIDKFECIDFRKALAFNSIREIIKNLRNSFFLVGHGANYTISAITPSTGRKERD